MSALRALLIRLTMSAIDLVSTLHAFSSRIYNIAEFKHGSVSSSRTSKPKLMHIHHRCRRAQGSSIKALVCAGMPETSVLTLEVQVV